MPEQQDTFEPASTATPADTPPENTADAAVSLEDRLQQAERKAAEHHDAWLRAKADAENIRRRAQEDVTKAHKFAVEGFSQELLAVRDSLEAALGVTSATVESMHSGVELTLRQLTTAFEKFDPHRHQAMTMVESDQPANTVVQVFQKGYLLHDRVLRPALVSVAKAPGA